MKKSNLCVHLEQSRPRDDVLALHVDELLHRETLVVRQVDEKGLGHDLQVLLDSESKCPVELMIKHTQNTKKETTGLPFLVKALPQQ